MAEEESNGWGEFLSAVGDQLIESGGKIAEERLGSNTEESAVATSAGPQATGETADVSVAGFGIPLEKTALYVAGGAVFLIVVLVVLKKV